MAKLYLENVPNDLYESLRERARSNRRSIPAEALSLLDQLLPTATKVRRRAAFYRRIQRLRLTRRATRGGSSAEELLREDRQR
jgi:plasmid stability protein